MCRRASGPRWGPRRPVAMEQQHVLPGPRPQVAPAALRRGRRPAGGHADAAERDRQRPARAGVRLRRRRAASARRRRRASSRARSTASTGPTAEPCGRCDACVEIAEGRDIDVLEIDAATHTGVDNVREVIIAGLSIPPVRDRYKIFIIDEVHQLSRSLVQRAAEVDRGAAAARRLHDGDDRARQDPRHDPLAIAGLRVPHDRRHGDRRAAPEDRRRRADRGRRRRRWRSRARGRRQHARRPDRVRPGAWRLPATAITADDVATVLGLVGRDLLLDDREAVADETGRAAFDAGRPRRRVRLRPAARLPRAVARWSAT